MSIRRPLLPVLALALLLGLAACGKKGAPQPPEGLEGEYTYPRAYPAPIGVVPRSSSSSEEESLSPLPEPSNDALSPFPVSRTKTRTY